MDARLEVRQSPRPVPADVEADAPLVTLAWRAQHEAHHEQAAERQRQEWVDRRVAELIVAVADEIHGLRRPGQRDPAGVASRLEQALLKLNVDVVVPEGAAYDGPLADLLENTARKPADVTEPVVAEVIQPAVLRNGELLRMGKAVIAVPAVTDQN